MLIGCPTHNRSQSLIRSLKSFNSSNVNCNFIVSHTGQENLTSLLGQETNNIKVWEGSERESWIQKLALNCSQSGIEDSVIKFALNPLPINGIVSTGANRNFLLLKLVGHKFISIDDDTIFESYRLPKVGITHHVPGTVVNPLSSIHFLAQQEIDIFKQKFKAISLSEFISNHEQMLAFSQNGLKCAMSLCGYFGDSGYQGPRSVFSIEESPLKSFLQKSDAFDIALKSRLVWRVSDRNQLFETSPVMLICAGLSNDYDLPPFFPIGRNQDGAFGYAVSACLDKMLIGHLDLAISHDPLETRAYEVEMPPLQLRINDLIALIWVELLKLKKSKNYSVAATHFDDIANNVNFKTHVIKIVSSHFLGRAVSIEQKINELQKENSKLFVSWIKAAEAERQKCLLAAGDMKYMIPLEAQLSSSNEMEAIELVQLWLLQYSKLLRSWELIRKIAATL